MVSESTFLRGSNPRAARRKQVGPGLRIELLLMFLSDHAVAPAGPPQPCSFRFEVYHSTAAPGTKTPGTKAAPLPSIQGSSCQGSLLIHIFAHGVLPPHPPKQTAPSYKMLMLSSLSSGHSTVLPFVSLSMRPRVPSLMCTPCLLGPNTQALLLCWKPKPYFVQGLCSLPAYLHPPPLAVPHGWPSSRFASSDRPSGPT